MSESAGVGDSFERTAQSEAPLVSVVIPSLSTERSESLAQLRLALSRQSLSDHEVLVISGVSPQGRAINLGADQARGKYLIVLDDDASIRDDRLLEKLIETLKSDDAIGMAGASCRTPDDASWLQRRGAIELPRFNVPITDEVVDSDLPCHGCAAFPRQVFEDVGREREEITRGLDPDLRQRLRENGYRVVLTPNAAIFHPIPGSLRSLVRTFLRNGRGSAFAQVHHPELVYETDENLDSSSFQAQRGFAYRIARFPLRIVWAAVTLRPIRTLAYSAYAVGYLTEYTRLRWRRLT